MIQTVVAAVNEIFATFLIGSFVYGCAITDGADTRLRRYWLPLLGPSVLLMIGSSQSNRRY